MTNFSFIVKLLSLVALLIGAVAPAEAATQRHRFAAPSENNHVLAQKVRASLVIDPTGRHPIDGTRCGRACATPEDLVDMLTRFDPLAPRDVNQLAAYIDGLTIVIRPPGEFWMACKTGNGDANSAPMWNCLTRVFAPGERAFVNPANGRVVLAGNCTNPVGNPVEQERCVELHFYLKPGDEVHIGWLGPQAFPQGDCEPAIRRTGETEWSNALNDECPRARCDFSGPARSLRMRVWDRPRVSFTATREGDNILRLPVEVTQSRSVFVLCIVRPNQGGRQSLGSDMHSYAYRDGRAYVSYDGIRGHIPAGWNGVVHRWLFTDGRYD